ncbi:STM3941 family protein [Actinoplanes aureus]|uniref:PH domain-containing protein n=1 Tax=Actinoplanes aureus TaxID=2792083 RepID=A0A931CQ00_9ACTN|nr:STM3941 family protein [Actinoplanes aureus]MBG0568960.1 hypothetical protein [Actinoplanes aureus]
MIVYRSLPKTAGLLLAAFALVAASAYMAFASSGPVLRVIGVFGALFFGYGAIRIGRQLLQRGPVIEVSEDGVRDIRLSPLTIPWHVVRGVDRLEIQRQRFVVLAVDEAFEKEYTSGSNRMLQRINRGTGFPGVNIGMTGLRATADELYQAILRNWQAAG